MGTALSLNMLIAREERLKKQKYPLFERKRERKRGREGGRERMD
jgi:hypothetical protein